MRVIKISDNDPARFEPARYSVDDEEKVKSSFKHPYKESANPPQSLEPYSPWHPLAEEPEWIQNVEPLDLSGLVGLRIDCKEKHCHDALAFAKRLVPNVENLECFMWLSAADKPRFFLVSNLKPMARDCADSVSMFNRKTNDELSPDSPA